MSKGPRPSFLAQAFRAKGRGLEPEQPQSARDEAHALRLVERLAAGKAGAIAIRQDGDPEMGDFDEPVVLKVIGRVPLHLMPLPY